MIVSWLLLAFVLVAIALFFTISTVLVLDGHLDDWFWRPIVVKKWLYDAGHFGVLPSMMLNYLVLWLVVRLLFSLTRTDYGINRQGLFFIFDAIEALIYAINSLVGIVVRLIMSIFAQMIFLARLDRSLLPGSLDRYDKFYKMYTAYTYVEHYHTHPVFVTALYFLVAEPSSASRSFVGLGNQPIATPSQRKRVRNRWQLLLTLVNNPALVSLRKHNLEISPRAQTSIANKGRALFSGFRSIGAASDAQDKYGLLSDDEQEDLDSVHPMSPQANSNNWAGTRIPSADDFGENKATLPQQLANGQEMTWWDPKGQKGRDSEA